jgi:uncharacterized cysteine cluster protein YcgN (CxxCxxCC family)
MSIDTASAVQLVPGRSCGECSLCCKLLRIDALSKPIGIWCTHCAPGRGGCTIYESRPAECRDFYCAWLTSAVLGPEWRPNKCKMFLRMEGNLVAVHVDPSDPTAWRREPFFQQLKEFANKAVGSKQQVAVYVKNRVIVIFPNKEVDVGIMNPGDELVVRQLWGPQGRDWTAFIESGARPRHSSVTALRE